MNEHCDDTSSASIPGSAEFSGFGAHDNEERIKNFASEASLLIAEGTDEQKEI